MLIKPKITEFSIIDKKQVAHETTEMVFDTSEQEFAFNPGQYIRLTMPSLSADVPKGNTRDFTIILSPDKKNIVQIAFRNSDSRFKQEILKAGKGTKIQAQGPLGVFTLPKDSSIPIVFTAGGMGITPCLSMIRFITANNTEHNIHIVYANASPKRAAYIDEIKLLAKNNSNINLTEKIGKVDAEFIKSQVKYTDKTLWYVCGVPEMTIALSKDIPKIMEVSEHNIRIEEYTGYIKNRPDYKVSAPVNSNVIEMTKEDVRSDKNLIDSLLNAVGQGALIAVTDAQGTIQYVNDKFIEIAKYSKDELIGQNHRILKSGFHTPEFYEELWKNISSGKIWRGELKNRAKDGTFYWVDTTITPIFDDKKNIRQYIAVRFLISDKKKLEQSEKITKSLLADVASEKEKLGTILQSIGDGVFVIDKDYQIILINKTALDMAGFSAKQAIGEKYDKILKFVFEENKKPNNQFIKEVFRTGKIQDMGRHTLLITKDKQEIPVADSAAPLKNTAGNVIGAVVVFRDIAKERQVDKAKTEFVSLASHQLRTPLTSIKWYAEMLLSGDAGKLKKEQKNFVTEIFEGNERMVGLVDALLNVSRLDLGTLMIEPEKINLLEIGQSVLKELMPQIKEKNLQAIKKFDKNIDQYNGDPKLLRIVFQNLLSNAVKYTPNNGQVSLEIKKHNQDILIKVSDTGIGIPKTQKDKIFTKLFRADNVKQSDTEGTGLGLYIVKSIIEHSGGRIWFESKENKGTDFYVVLPGYGMKKRQGSKKLGYSS